MRTRTESERTLDPTIRLRIATRIHFAPLRQYGEDVAVSTLLRDGGDAREALWVCEASSHDELVLLASSGACLKPSRWLRGGNGAH